LLIDGLARLTTDGRAEATPIARRAAEAIADLSIDDILRAPAAVRPQPPPPPAPVGAPRLRAPANLDNLGALY
jgi:hypothetical protein